MSEGWILDAHLRSGSDLVTVWVKEDSGAVSEHSFRWSPVIHVSGRPESLQELEVFLTGSVCRSLFGTVSIAKERRLTSHGCDAPVEVLSIGVPRASSLTSIARAIADRGAGRSMRCSRLTQSLLRGSCTTWERTHSEGLE